MHLETARKQCQALSEAPAACLSCAYPVPARGQGEGTDAEALGKMRRAMRDAQPCVVQLLNYKKNGVRCCPRRRAAGCSGQGPSSGRARGCACLRALWRVGVVRGAKQLLGAPGSLVVCL